MLDYNSQPPSGQRSLALTDEYMLFVVTCRVCLLIFYLTVALCDMSDMFACVCV